MGAGAGWLGVGAGCGAGAPATCPVSAASLAPLASSTLARISSTTSTLTVTCCPVTPAVGSTEMSGTLNPVVVVASCARAAASAAARSDRLGPVTTSTSFAAPRSAPCCSVFRPNQAAAPKASPRLRKSATVMSPSATACRARFAFSASGAAMNSRLHDPPLTFSPVAIWFSRIARAAGLPLGPSRSSSRRFASSSAGVSVSARM